MQIDFYNLTIKNFGDLISKFNLTAFAPLENEIFLKGHGFTLSISYDREDVSILYFDKSVEPPKGYNVFDFLFNKRHDKLAPPVPKSQPDNFEEYIDNYLHRLSLHMQYAGEDILNGSKEWIASYPWPAIKLDERTSSFI